MAEKGMCHVCGQILILEGPEDCPVNHAIPKEDKAIALRDIVLTNGLVIPKGTEVLVEASGDKNVRFWWVDSEGELHKNTMVWKDNLQKAA